MFIMNNPEILSVSAYLDKINLRLKVEKSKILGEVSGIQEYPGRSYLYFSIKDSKDQSTIKCFMWKRDYTISGVSLKEGMEVVLTAYPSIYKPNGGISLQVESIELVGEGALKLAYDELKNKLEKEGLFSPDKKRDLPLYPNKIGVITSKSGAVINDFLTNIGKFGFKISFVDSKVEGADAIKDLLIALDTLEKEDIDVLVMMRGGGSLESFMAFNNEVLVRKVANFPVPVITGIGHDKDAPLVSFVSDQNVSTPTAVANLLNESWNEALSKVSLAEEKILSKFSAVFRDKQFLIDNSEVLIQNSFSKVIEVFRKAEGFLTQSIVLIESAIKQNKINLENYSKSIISVFSNTIKYNEEKIRQITQNINILSPESQLKRGYSIVRKNGKLVKSTKDAKKGEKLDISVSDGIISSIIQ